jgi:hypothetical protein
MVCLASIPGRCSFGLARRTTVRVMPAGATVGAPTMTRTLADVGALVTPRLGRASANGLRCAVASTVLPTRERLTPTIDQTHVRFYR